MFFFSFFLIIVGGVVLCFVGYFIWIVRIFGRVMIGLVIDWVDCFNMVLLVIDVQEDFMWNSFKFFVEVEWDEVIVWINCDIEMVCVVGEDVILIKQVFCYWLVILVMKFLMCGIGMFGCVGLVFDWDLKIGDVCVFEKLIGDVFFNLELEVYLVECKIGYLCLMGLDVC